MSALLCCLLFFVKLTSFSIGPFVLFCSGMSLLTNEFIFLSISGKVTFFPVLNFGNNVFCGSLFLFIWAELLVRNLVIPSFGVELCSAVFLILPCSLVFIEPDCCGLYLKPGLFRIVFFSVSSPFGCP